MSTLYGNIILLGKSALNAMEVKNSKSIIAIGFITVLGIIAVLLVVWIDSVSKTQDYLENIKQNQNELYLLISLSDEVYISSQIAHQLIEVKSSRGSDEILHQLREAKSNIEQVVSKLNLIERHAHGYTLWMDIRNMLQRYYSSVDEAIELEKVNHDEAEDLLYHFVVPIQRNIMAKLLELRNDYKDRGSSGVVDALDRNSSVYYMIMMLGTVAFLLGLLNIFVIRQAGKSEAALLEQGQRIRKIYEITTKPGLSIEEQIREILKLGCQMLGMEIGKVCKIDIEANTNSFLNVYAPEGFSVCAGTVMPLERTFCSITSRKDAPIAIHNVAKTKYAKQFSHLAAYIATTISVSGKKWGSVNFSSNVAREIPFTESDKDLLKLIGAWVSATLDRRFAQEEILIAKNEAESASRTKSAFLASMSHELRTPLNAIIGYSELIKEEAEYNKHEMYDADLHKINSSALHLLALIDDILDLSKIEAGKMEIYMEYFDVAALVNEVSATVQPLMRKKNNEFSVILQPELGNIYADRLKVKQILLNLLSNASKFTEEGSVVLSVKKETRKLENEEASEWFEFSVKDTGIGISDEQISKIFQAFSQADVSTTSKYGGTGLGLAISRQICYMMGGDILVKGAIGQGSEFKLRLPVNSRK